MVALIALCCIYKPFHSHLRDQFSILIVSSKLRKTDIASKLEKCKLNPRPSNTLCFSFIFKQQRQQYSIWSRKVKDHFTLFLYLYSDTCCYTYCPCSFLFLFEIPLSVLKVQIQHKYIFLEI